MSKDRAAPFSRKHRKYWIPVTGGMILIGLINVGLGFWSYEKPEVPQRMELNIPHPDAAVVAPGSVGLGELPAPVMRAWAIKYPRILPAGARKDGDNYTLLFPPNKGHASATFSPDGSFITEQ